MKKRLTFIFPGQGAQGVGMGKEFIQNKAFKETLEKGCDLLNRDLRKIMFEGPEEELNLTKNSQPALFIYSIALFEMLKKEFPQLAPHTALGLSLGEYSAFVAAGILPFEETLRVVQARGDLMGKACEMRPGTMAVVLGLEADQVIELVKEANLPSDLWAANFNSPGQVVISGTERGIAKGTELAKAKGAKRVLPLAVQGAFHSGLMESALKGLQPLVDTLPIKESPTKVVMNVSANYPANSSEIRKNLVLQVTHPVLWAQSIDRVKGETEIFVEAGYGETLKGLNKRIGVFAPTMTFKEPADLETFAKEIL